MKGPLLAALVCVFSVASLGASTASDELLQQAKSAYEKQSWQTAADLFSRFLKEFPDDAKLVEATFLRGVSQLQAGQGQAALDTFQKLDRGHPLSDYRRVLPYWKGVSALASGLLSVAERELVGQGQYKEQTPWFERSLFQLALVKQKQGQAAPMRQYLLSFLEVSREAEWEARAEVLLAHDSRQFTTAREAADHALRASSLAPGTRWDLEARRLRVELHLASQAGIEALLLIDESSRLFPSEVEFWTTRTIEAARQAGNSSVALDAISVRLTQKITALERQKLETNRALLAEKLGKPELDWWIRAANGPDKALTASAQLKQVDLLESAAEWAQAAKILATRPDLEHWLARSANDWRKAGDVDASKLALDRLIQDFPRSPSVPEWLEARASFALERGENGAALRDLDRVAKDYRSYVRLPEVKYQTGLVYLQRNEPLRAEAYFFGLIQELKQGELYQRALLARGQCFVNAGKSELAEGTLERLIREAPLGLWTGEAWYALARNRLRNQDPEKAWEAFQKASAHVTDPHRKALIHWEGLEGLAVKGDAPRLSRLYREFPVLFPAESELVPQAFFRSGEVLAAAELWSPAVEVWESHLSSLTGQVKAKTLAGLAVSYLRLGRESEGLSRLELLDTGTFSDEIAAEAWFAFGQTATALGFIDLASRAYNTLIARYPSSGLVEKALPRAAGALLGGEDLELALARYGDFFRRFGRQTSSASVARAAAQASSLRPELLEALVNASRKWDLAPEVRTEFDLAWWRSVLDVDPAKALVELQILSREAPWSSQRSQALALAGSWSLTQGRTQDARQYFEAAGQLGDDLSIFRARLGLAQTAAKEGRGQDGARLRESAEKGAGAGVPLEFRVSALRDALAVWEAEGKSEDVRRVKARLEAIGRN